MSISIQNGKIGMDNLKTEEKFGTQTEKEHQTIIYGK